MPSEESQSSNQPNSESSASKSGSSKSPDSGPSAPKATKIAPTQWTRQYGDTALETMKSIVDEGFSDTGGTVVVATTSGYWDALAGAALCGKKNSVLVLVGDASSSSIGGFVSENSATEISAYVFGGPAAVGDDVAESFQSATAAY